MSEIEQQIDCESGAARGTCWTGLDWACLVAAGLVLLVFRLHAFELPLETDECNYAYIGARLLAGDRLYIDVWDHQPFGVFVLFAGVISVFGDAPDVFRWLAVGFSLASLVLVFAIVRSCAGRSAAVLAAVLFALASSDPGTAGEGCNREIYMSTAVLAAWFLAMRSRGTGRWCLLSAGLALGVGSTIKTILALHWFFLAGWLVWVAWQDAPAQRRLRRSAVSVAMLAVGPALVWLLGAAYFAATERWAEFVDAVFLFNLSYSEGSESFWMRFVRFFAPLRHPFIFDSALPLWLASIPATLWLLAKGLARRRGDAVAVVLLVMGAFAGVCLPGRFWPHYYYLLIAPACVVVGAAFGDVAHGPPGARSEGHRRRSITIALGVLIAACLAVTEYRDYIRQQSFGITIKRYNSRDFWGRAHGLNVRRITDPDDEIFVFGNDAEIYYYANRRCASRYTMITGLQSGYAGVQRRREIMLAELEDRLPRLILVLFDEPPFPAWHAFLEEHYGEPIGWDRHDRTGKPIMFVLARKGDDIERIDWNWDRSEVGGWFLGDRE